jgi:hypothetical protein
LRAVVDRAAIDEMSITLDRDVLNADGWTLDRSRDAAKGISAS